MRQIAKRANASARLAPLSSLRRSAALGDRQPTALPGSLTDIRGAADRSERLFKKCGVPLSRRQRCESVAKAHQRPRPPERKPLARSLLQRRAIGRRSDAPYNRKEPLAPNVITFVKSKRYGVILRNSSAEPVASGFVKKFLTITLSFRTHEVGFPLHALLPFPPVRWLEQGENSPVPSFPSARANPLKEMKYHGFAQQLANAADALPCWQGETGERPCFP